MTSAAPADRADDASPADNGAAQEALKARLEAIYREQHRFVWHCVRRLGAPDEASEDAVHEVFMVAARRLGEFEGRASIKTWLFAIAMRVVQAQRRALRRHRRRAEALARESDPPPATHHGRSEAAALLHRLLDTLDDDKRAVFILAELEGMSAPEIADATETNVNTVYARLRAARKRIERAALRMSAQDAGRFARATGRGP